MGFIVDFYLFISQILLFLQFASIMGDCGTWRGGRVVEGAALEMLFGGNFNEGSNPSLSAL